MNPLWENLLKQRINNHRTFWWNPEFLNVFLEREERKRITWDLEWKEPPDWDFLIHHYTDKYHFLSSKYTINKYGEVKSLRWEIMKYLFYPNKRWPRVRLQITIKKDWRYINTEREFSVYKLMEQTFRNYIKWYNKKKNNPKDFILVPKDWNENNMRYDNLEYIDKWNWRKRKYIENLLLYNDVSVETICRLLNTTPKYVNKILAELARKRKFDDLQLNPDSKKWDSKENKWIVESYQLYEELQDELWIQFTRDNFEIYQILINSKWELSNMEIARKLRPEEISNTEMRRKLTDKIVRARKKLTDRWLIPRFNKSFELKRALAVAMLQNKPTSWMTNEQIANCLWLKKGQIDNLYRQIKKDAMSKKEK